MVKHCFYGLPFTRKHLSELHRERQSASISTTLDYILAHGSCHRLRAGQRRKCHREQPSMEAPSSRSDETEMNHDDVHSCSFRPTTYSPPCVTSAGARPSKITNLASVTSH